MIKKLNKSIDEVEDEFDNRQSDLIVEMTTTISGIYPTSNPDDIAKQITDSYHWEDLDSVKFKNAKVKCCECDEETDVDIFLSSRLLGVSKMLSGKLKKGDAFLGAYQFKCPHCDTKSYFLLT